MKSAEKKSQIGESVVRIEAEALRELAARIRGPMADAFDHALAMLHACKGRVVVTGMGKSGIIARKVAATLSSTGTPALFLHPAEAIHGDLGVLVRGDIVLALSSSGETEEILRLLATIKRLGIQLISVTGDKLYNGAKTSKNNHKKISTLAAAADIALDCSVDKEACSLGLAPTASTTAMLALVESLMHSGEAIPRVGPHTKMHDVIYEMSRKGLGITTVVERERLVGIISDGDLRRLLEKRGKDVMDLTAKDCMTRSPQTISPTQFASAALNIMEQRKITALVVVDSNGKVAGIVHLHDLWGTEML